MSAVLDPVRSAPPAVPSKRGKPRTFRPEIQLLRAIAVLTVVIYHLNPSWLPGGFVGVDVFFVISGFLITGHMIREVERTERLSLLKFWVNRAKRILPAATLTIVLTAIASVFLLPVTQLTAAAVQGMASALYVQNWALAFKSVDYLTQDSADSPFQHFWSLSIEEQFYLFWPLLALGAGRIAFRWGSRGAAHRRFRVLLAMVFGLVVAASFVYSATITLAGEPEAYFVTQSRVWELGAGGLLALVMVDTERFRTVRSVLALGGLVAIGVACIFYTGAQPPFPGVAALLPVLGTMAVIAAGRTSGPLSLHRVVDLQPVQLVGNLSYSLYLWHFPLITFFVAAKGRHPGLFAGSALFVLALLFAAGSYFFVENPVRRWRHWTDFQWKTILTAGVSMVTAAAVAVLPQLAFAVDQHQQKVAVETLLHKHADELGHNSLGRHDFTRFVGQEGVTVPSITDALNDEPEYDCDQTPAPADSLTTPQCVIANPDGKKTLAVVGDSHASQWTPALKKAVEGTDWRVVVYLHNSCPFSLGERSLEADGTIKCKQANKETLERLKDLRPQKIVVAGYAKVGFERMDGEKRPGVTGYSKMFKQLKKTGATVYALQDNPVPPGNVPDCLARHTDDLEACDIPRADSSENTGANRVMRTAAQNADVKFVGTTSMFCTEEPHGVCPAIVGSTLVYRDHNHVTGTYMWTLAPSIAKKLEL
ncbi:acyltransferase family protein [Brevibacterium sp. HMSC22B09]|uniref:acyltransferase family protein n=1 Tax=Brevibacterium sp. HMSC22B09 TaxID=1581055 RepID=UPI0008B87FCF|nr:acyltransferase family protein [Brevibacterium sp. HMSC22B09]OFT97914.1 hypothetical protein HMPREF3087_03515 [Brevibacterium sp. HMSC22B09]